MGGGEICLNLTIKIKASETFYPIIGAHLVRRFYLKTCSKQQKAVYVYRFIIGGTVQVRGGLLEHIIMYGVHPAASVYLSRCQKFIRRNSN